MSVEASMWALDAPTVNATEKAILMVLANYVGADGTCYPGQDTIAAKATCSVKSVERILAAFEARGWIKRYARRRRDGSRTSDLIEFASVVAPERIENAQPDTVSGCGPTRHRVQTNPTSCPIQPDTVSGLTTFEPLGEQEGEAAAVAREPVREAVNVPHDDWPAGLALDHAHALTREADTVRLDPARQPGLIQTLGRLAAWKRDGASWLHDVVPVVSTMARKQGPPIKSWKFFDEAIAQSIADNAAALTIPEAQNAHPAPDRGARSSTLDRDLDRYARSGAGSELAAEVVAARRAF